MNNQLFDHPHIVTIERHILEEQQYHPEATGILTSLLYDVALAGKVIASKTVRAGLAEILGRTGEVNIQGEHVQKLDRLADRTIIRLNDHTGRLAAMASEEHQSIIKIPEKYPIGKYVLLFDPLDGSSNIDFNVPIGTIFAIYHRISKDGPGSVEDCLQPGSNLVCAGYLLYGSSTMLVYTTGHGVHGFTLDPTVGEFLLSHKQIKFEGTPKYFSANLGNYSCWSPGIRHFTDTLQGRNCDRSGLSLRYVGSLVADFHRNLLSGGIFYYPGEYSSEKTSKGKLRLVYECAPLSFIAEQAGGRGSDGHQNILDIHPIDLHQRTSFFVGNQILIDQAEEMIRTYG
jgi:fructose-1,6-bisphosphatase I